MEQSGQPKTAGRPRKYPPGRINATVRFTPMRYAELKAAADSEGRSVSEEVEYRINGATDKLIGLFGYILDHFTSEVKHAFQITDRLHEPFYLVKLVSTLDGFHNGDVMIVTMDMLRDYGRCRLYFDRDRWLAQAEELDRRARDKAAQQEPQYWINDKGQRSDANGKPLP